MHCFRFDPGAPPPPPPWSRFVNSGLIPDNALRKEQALKNKDNALLTKKLRYAKIARGAWTNGKQCWGSQSANFPGTTNPNINSFMRINATTVDSNTGLASDAPLSQCSPPRRAYSDPTMPPPVPLSSTAAPPPVMPPPAATPPPPTTTTNTNTTTTPSTPLLPVVIYAAVSSAIKQKQENIIQLSGTLVCDMQVQPCSGELLNAYQRDSCFSASASGINCGGTSLLCAKVGAGGAPETNFATVRRTYASGNTKWPQGAKLNA